MRKRIGLFLFLLVGFRTPDPMSTSDLQNTKTKRGGETHRAFFSRYVSRSWAMTRRDRNFLPVHCDYFPYLSFVCTPTVNCSYARGATRQARHTGRNAKLVEGSTTRAIQSDETLGS